MKPRVLWSFIFVMAWLAFSGACSLGAETPDCSVVTNDCQGALFLNAPRLYDLLLKTAQALDSGATSVLVKEIKAHAGSAEGPSPADFLRGLLDWDKSGICRPTGGLWFSLDQNMAPRLFLPVSCKPLELWKFLQTRLYLEDVKPPADHQGNIRFVVKIRDDMKPALEIRSDSISFGTFPARPDQLNSSWDGFIKKTKGDEALFALDLNPGVFTRNVGQARQQARAKACSANMRVILGATEIYGMDSPTPMTTLDFPALLQSKYLKSIPVCPDGGEYEISGDISKDGTIRCSVHNTVQDLRVKEASEGAKDDSGLGSIKRIRMFFHGKSVMVAAASPDAGGRKAVADFIRAFIEDGRSKLGSSETVGWSGFSRSEAARTLLDRIKIEEKGPWVGASLTAASEEEMVLTGFAAVGIVSAIAIPNFRKARDEARMKACFANQRVMLGAVEMYNMDHTDMLTAISEQDIGPDGMLVKEKYLGDPIKKPEPTCEYETIGDLTKDGHISCKKHGQVP